MKFEKKVEGRNILKTQKKPEMKTFISWFQKWGKINIFMI